MRITKQQLRMFRAQANEIRLLSETIRAIRDTFGAKASDPSKSPVHSENSSATERTVEKIIDIEAVYSQKINDYKALQLEIESAMEKLSPDERSVIRLYYFNLNTWEETAKKIHFSYQHTHRLHASALNKLNQGGNNL